MILQLIYSDILSKDVSCTNCFVVYVQFGVYSIWNKQPPSVDIYKSTVFAAQGLRFVSVSNQ